MPDESRFGTTACKKTMPEKVTLYHFARRARRRSARHAFAALKAMWKTRRATGALPIPCAGDRDKRARGSTPTFIGRKGISGMPLLYRRAKLPPPRYLEEEWARIVLVLWPRAPSSNDK